MNIHKRLEPILAFKTVATTILLVLVYSAIVTTVLVADKLPPIPKDIRGLDLDQAWWDLHQLSVRPHPFNSHANDLVRDFILERLGNVTLRHSHVVIDYDVVSNASWVTDISVEPRAVYQEGSNILVKVQGTDSAFRDSGGCLLSAHYDSVSTAPGATDDSTGIVTLLQMVEYFAEHRPKRTVIFNFNNNEESGLNGAHAFLEHPWLNISDVFLNLDGTAVGGRPVMFRATNIAPLFSWTGNHVTHPHANVVFSDSFLRGVIRSATDDSVYEAAGLDGLEFTFYKGRSRHHTWRDSISGMEGGKKSLWAMMEATHGASLALANDDAVHAQPLPRQEKPVFFELFNTTLVIVSLETLFITNVVLLSAGPILLLLLAYSKHAVRASGRNRPRFSAQPNGNGAETDSIHGDQAVTALKGYGNRLWSSTRFWVALVISIGLKAALIAGYVNLNPFILHSHPFLVFTSALSLAYLSTVLVLSFPCNGGGTVSTQEKQKLSILLQLYGFTWILLVFSTAVLRSAEIGSTYFVTAWNFCAFLGCVVALVEARASARGFEDYEDESHTCVGSVLEEDADRQQSSYRIEEDSEPTETTPLVPREHSHTSMPRAGEELDATGWWILQFLLAVPLPVVLVFHISVMLLGAMSQTLTDGNSPAFAYRAVSLLALLLVLPISPFILNAHRSFTFVMVAIFILSTVYALLAFPFSPEAPLKVFFVQSVTLNTSGAGIEHTITELTGPKGFLTRHIISELPSAFGKPLACYDAPNKVGLQTCAWDVGAEMAPSPGGRKGGAAWVSYDLDRTGYNSAQFTIQGLNTRFCTLSFANRRISKFSVVGDGDKGLQRGYDVAPEGVNEIQLWSRDFGKRFEVSVEWRDEDEDVLEEQDGLVGQVSCGWDEYESAAIGGGRSGGQIPSLEEVIQFLPEWAAVSVSKSALVSAGMAFEV